MHFLDSMLPKFLPNGIRYPLACESFTPLSGNLASQTRLLFVSHFNADFASSRTSQTWLISWINLDSISSLAESPLKLCGRGWPATLSL